MVGALEYTYVYPRELCSAAHRIIEIYCRPFHSVSLSCLYTYIDAVKSQIGASVTQMESMGVKMDVTVTQMESTEVQMGATVTHM
jgi:hypothetical protein